MLSRELLLDLRDHLVGAAVEREIVDVAAAQHRAQRAADVAHLQAELGRLVAVDHDRGLRRVDLEVGVQEDEAAGGECLLQELLRHLVQRLERPGRVDDELDRQAGASPAAAAAGRPRPARRRCLPAPAARSAAAGWRSWCAGPTASARSPRSTGRARRAGRRDRSPGWLDADRVDLARVDLALVDGRVGRRGREAR